MVEIAHELAALIKIRDRLDEDGKTRSSLRSLSLEHCQQIAWDKFETLEKMADQLQAKTLEGALFQVMLVNSEIGYINETNMTDFEMRAIVRRLKRLLHSVAAVLEREAGIDRGTIGGGYYMTPELDPFAQLEAELKRD